MHVQYFVMYCVERCGLYYTGMTYLRVMILTTYVFFTFLSNLIKAYWELVF